ncbi:MAG: hypothetical protein COC01_10290 [Bacteroidetes bacterium]|nr:MAG: hypothetical protein COC01_10290 [Bacteroidota bacterium]
MGLISDKKKIRIVKKCKAYFIRFKMHRVLGPFANLMIFTGYLSKLSKWVEQNKIPFDDFYNNKVLHKNRTELYQHLCDTQGLDKAICFMDFGVGYGNSLKWWLQSNKDKDSKFYGFDTFVGLPERFGPYKKGEFDQGGTFPKVDDDRCSFVKGLFQDSLQRFLLDNTLTQKKVINLDGDLYSSTLFVLTTIAPYLKEGDILMFDEFGVPLHEFRAYEDFVKSYYFKLEVLGAKNNYLTVVFKVI